MLAIATGVTRREGLGKPKVYCMFVHMQSLSVIERQFVDALADLYDADETRQLCFMLLEERFGWSKNDYLRSKEQPLTEQDIRWLQSALRSLQTAKPIQYILGHAWFMGMKLIVNQSVLIPRPETEELVHLMISRHQPADGVPLRIIDIGTGSGCIAIALKKTLPRASVYALDFSAEALDIAKQNAELQSAEIRFINADILEWETVFQENQVFDIIVSNPPYITANEQPEMHQNVLAYEPHLALFVEDSAPLLFYEHIASFASVHLRPAGHLYFEINRKYGQQVCELLRKKDFKEVQCLTDIHGADRIVHATKKNSYQPTDRS